jgi:ferrous iron transport protein B
LKGDRSCHGVVDEVKGEVDFLVALAGNPNTGKSTLFNHLTGLNAVTANYPGKTVELNIGSSLHDGINLAFIDLPGTYALGAISEDQWVARRSLFEYDIDVLIVVVDASNLARNLYLVLQCLELNKPVVIALNMVDYAVKTGQIVDATALSKLLGVPVVETVASRGQGVKNLVETVINAAKEGSKRPAVRIEYSERLSAAIADLERFISELTTETPQGVTARFAAMMLLEGDAEFIELYSKLKHGREIVDYAKALTVRGDSSGSDDLPLDVSRERHALASNIADRVTSRTSQPALLSQRLRDLSVSPHAGLPLLAGVMIALFSTIFYVGGLLSDFISGVWESAVSPLLHSAVGLLLGTGVAGKVILWGIDAGILAWLTVGVPYVLTFYLLLSFLEDSGYLNSIAFLLDSTMHKLGLHGRAIIPLLAGAGCNVPAIMGTRVLSTRRERFIASTLIVMVPCSARLAVIVGAVANTIGWAYGFFILGFEALLVGVVGVGLNRILPGKPYPLVMEMFPFRIPSLWSLSKKTWYRFKDFVFIALPLITIGSFAVGALYETGFLWSFNSVLAPLVTGLLGLPSVVGLVLVLGILRKELTLELLLALAVVQYGATGASLQAFMSPVQLLVFAVVVTIYVPCVATVSVLAKELGWKDALKISAFTIGLAVLVGAIMNGAVTQFGLVR